MLDPNMKPAAGGAPQNHELLIPSNSSPPPSYAVDDENAVPNITAAFSNLNLEPSRQPTPDQCIAHLKLLEAFHQLREDVALHDGLFGLQDDFVPSSLAGRQREAILTKIREKRWAVYVVKAVERFRRWWQTTIEPGAERLKQKDIPTVFRQKVYTGHFLAIGKDRLPPLGELCLRIMEIAQGILLNRPFRCYHGLACLSTQSTRFP